MSSVPCKFYSSGKCRQGESCRFSHAPPPLPSFRSSSTCRFWESGHCRFGDRCRFSHVAENEVGKGQAFSTEELKAFDRVAVRPFAAKPWKDDSGREDILDGFDGFKLDDGVLESVLAASGATEGSWNRAASGGAIEPSRALVLRIDADFTSPTLQDCRA
jgi:hypothetical protein